MFFRISEQTATLAYAALTDWDLKPRSKVFTARYGLGL